MTTSPVSLAPKLILVSRAGKGTGGMQQLTNDLAKGFQDKLGTRCTVIIARGFFGVCLLPFRTIFAALNSPKNTRLHLCDASLVPLGAFIQFFRNDLQVSVTACGLDVLYPAKWYQFLLRRSLPRMNSVVGISRATADLVEECGVSIEKITVIPCGIWKSTLAQSPKKNTKQVLLTVGRLIPRKGVLWFLQKVFPELLISFPELQYNIVGDGKLQSSIRKYVEEKNLASHVHLYGNLTDAERDRLYSEADLFVMPNISLQSDIEGFGIVALEAGMHGVPVVAADTGGIPDAIIPDVSGILYTAGNAEECRKSIEKALETDWSAQEISHAVKERYSWDRLLDRYIHEVFRF